MRRSAAAIVALALIVAACTGESAAPTDTTAPSSDPATTASTTTASTSTTTTVPLDQSLGPVAAPVRHPATARSIYFVMPDRFENGDPSNDTAGVDGTALEHGFDPTRKGYHHGGDLAGLTARLPYIADLGIGAIWITPPFTNRFVQGDGTLDGSTSSYHGYWQIDFDRIDPHLGTEEEMQAFIAAAHELDIHVYFDIVINHTGDVITYAENEFRYRAMRGAPYLDADGNEFDPAELAGGDTFPELDADVSFPYTPTFVTPDDATVKSPDWLNDVTLYHNRGDSTFRDESDTFGDFFGLDDLFTEHPRVVEGMIELYGDVIERYDIDGFRVDTMKHVNIEFWEAFAPAILERAAELGKPDFYVFGEVFSEDQILHTTFTQVGVPATLDFIGARGIERYLESATADRMAQAFDLDDWFTDHDNNASMQVAFFGNHDEGRMGHLLERAAPGAGDDVLLPMAKLANDLLFLARGTPVVYYGDEQGFTGDGGDQLARHDMFPSVTPEYLDDDMIGTDATAADDNFDPDHELYRHIQTLNALCADHPTLVSGAQIVHETDGGVFAFSRIDRDERIEYVVLVNAGLTSATTTVDALSADTTFVALRSDESMQYVSDVDGNLTLDLPALSTIVLRAEAPHEPPVGEPTITLTRPDEGDVIPTARYRIEAELGDERYAEVTFAVSVDGADHEVVGVDDAPPYRVYWANGRHPAGAEVEIVATVDDGSGRLRSDVVTATLGDRTR